MADETKKTVIIDVQTNANDATQQMDGLKSAVNEVTQAGDKMTNGMLSSFKKLATNPYVAAIGVALAAIVGAFRKLRDAINNSDDAGTAFARLGAVLKAPLQLINKLVDTLANGLGKLANVFADVLMKIMPEKWREQAEAENEVVVATDNLEEAERTYSENHAQREAQRSELLRKARNEEEYSAEERIKALQEVARLEKQDFEEHKQILQERLRIEQLSLRNKKSLSDEEKNRVQDIKNQLVALQTEYNRSLKEVDRMSKSVTEKLVEHWIDVEKQHHNANEEIEKYYNNLVKIEREEIYKNLAEQADQYWEAMFPTNDAFKNTSAEDRKAVLDVFNAIKSGSTDAIESLKYTKDYLDKRWLSMTDAQKKLYGVITDILGSYSKLDEISARTANNIMEANKKVADGIKKGAKDGEKATDDSKDKQVADLKELGERYENTFALMTALKLEYEEKSNAISKEISDYESKLAKATTDKEKDYYTSLIDVKKQKLKELSTTYFAELKKFTPTTDEFVPDFHEDEIASHAGELAKTVVKNTQEAVQGLQDAIDAALEDEAKLEEKRQQMIKDRELIVESNLSMLQSFGQIAGAIAQSYQDQIDSIMSKEGELTNTEIEQIVDLTEKKRDATIAQLALNQAVAIGQAIVAATSAAAQSGIAAPFVYAATAATILAGLISTFVEANNVAQQADEQIAKLQQQKKYATGGYVEGAGTATSDSIPARLSNGEAVINARSTAMYYDLLSAINQRGGGIPFPNAQNTPIIRFAQGGVATNTAQIVEAVKTAVSDIQPVVSVKEITRVQNRIKAKETL